MRPLLLLLIRLYQLGISPVLRALSGGQPTCRFTPSCSHYFADALKTHGTLKGTFLGMKRILRCHPWGGSGYDPIPERPIRDKAETLNSPPSEDH